MHEHWLLRRFNTRWECPPPSRLTKTFAVMMLVCCGLVPCLPLQAQTLIDVDFGVGSKSAKVGFAATGQGTNDFWNLYRHYDPKFVSGMPLVTNGVLNELKLADGSPTPVSLSVSNAPGIWGNASGDPMFDTYVFAPNGSNLVVTLRNLPPGRYHVFLYGHADRDVSGEQNSCFLLHSGTNTWGPRTAMGAAGWKSHLPWNEGQQYVVFRDVPVGSETPVVIEVAAGPNGIAVLNGLQVLSRGTSPPEPVHLVSAPGGPGITNVLFRSVRYDGKISDSAARFATTIELESLSTNEISALLFEGDVALITQAIPDGIRVANQGDHYHVYVAVPGRYKLELEVHAKIARGDSWNQVSFRGPAAAMASVQAEAEEKGMELQLLSGTSIHPSSPAKEPGSPGISPRLEGFIGADRLLSLRWQGKAAEITRKPLITVQATVQLQVTPSVMKHVTELNYEILQAPVPKLTLQLPPGQTLTRLQGEQIRDWQIKADSTQSLLTVEFIKPIEKAYRLILFSEQPVDFQQPVSLSVPQTLDVARETGSWTLQTEDVQAELTTVTGLRQINAPPGALASFRFFQRPLNLSAVLSRIQPVVQVADRMRVRLEETRCQVTHQCNLQVEKAGIYALEWMPQAGFVITEVRGEGIDDWGVKEGRLRISYANRVLGARQLTVTMERSWKQPPDLLDLTPLKLSQAEKEQAQVGVLAAPGLQVKTSEVTGLREIPIQDLTDPSDEWLAYAADQPGWRLILALERLAPRVIAEVFNLVTIGDGMVGGSATIRYVIVNQGVQELRLKIPAHWKNVEFTGAQVRRRELKDGLWVIGLQDKVWTGYTLVVTYDFSFDPKGATLAVGGLHTDGTERESGSVVLTAAPGVQLKPQTTSEILRRIDEAEVSSTDRALITRPVLLAYRYSGQDYQLTVEASRFETVQMLAAVADRTQLTTLLTEDGQQLTQASFMVKNHEKQFQRFKLPSGAEFWSCFVNGNATKVERDGEWFLVPLPRQANRDQTFAVEMVYKQKGQPFKSWWPRRVKLEAPKTDVPNTYAEWRVFVPPSHRLSGFGGNMLVAAGTTYGLREAWTQFLQFYRQFIRNLEPGALVLLISLLIVALLIITAMRRGWRGFLTALGIVFLLAILAGMFLPALSKAKAKSSRRYDQLEQRELAAAAELAPQAGTPLALVPPAPAAQAVEDKSSRLRARYGLPVTRGAGVVADAVAQPGMVGGAVAGRELAEARGIEADTPPLAAGIQPIRIEIPQTGFAFLFTKVLNVGDEALWIQARVLPLKSQVSIRMIFQLAVFLFGLVWFWRQWRSPRGSGFRLALASSLVLAATTHMLIGWRALHYGLIAAAPLVVVVALASLVVARWRRARPMAKTSGPDLANLGDSAPGGTSGSAGATLLTGLLLALTANGLAPSAEANPPALEAKSTVNRPWPALTNTVSIVSAEYKGEANQQVAWLEANLDLVCAQTNQWLTLFGPEVALQSFQTAPTNIQVMRQNDAVVAWFPNAGKASLSLKIVGKLEGNVSEQFINFRLPPALASRLSLSLDEAEADVEFPSAISWRRVLEGRRTRVEAVLGAKPQVDLRWRPKVKRAEEIAAAVFCQSASRVILGEGVVNVRSLLDYQVTQGELRQVRLQLPDGYRLLHIEGELIRTWNQDRNTLTVELQKGVSTAYRLVMETEKALDAQSASVPIQVPQPLDVKRFTGLIGLRATEELALNLEAQELQRIDSDEFARAYGQEVKAIAGAYRFLKPEFELSARIEPLKPQIECVVANHLALGFSQSDITAKLDYQIKRAGVFSVSCLIPEGYRVISVKGDQIAQWNEKTSGNRRQLEVQLKERVTGRWSLTLQLQQPLADLPKTWLVSGVHPLDIDKLTGFVVVSAEPGIALKTDLFTGLTEVPASTASALAPSSSPSPPPPKNTTSLAFKLLVAETRPADQPWKLTLQVETMESWVRAEVFHSWRLSENLIHGRAVVRYEIANAPIQEFRLRTPASFANVELNGPNIRRRDRDGAEWRIAMQSKVRGNYELVVTWTQPCSIRSNLLELASLETVGIERETGALAILAQAPLQVVERQTDGLQRIDTQDLPAWAGRFDSSAVLAYRYVRPGYHLSVAAQRFEEAQVLQALVDEARLTSVVADDGQMMTEMTLAVRNNGRQFLGLQLPAGAQVWSAFVAGQPVPPSQQGDRLLLPLEKTRTGDRPLSVELIYTSRCRFPQKKGGVELDSPSLDVPLKNARWQLYLPPEYQYDHFRGSMNAEAEPAAFRAVADYSQTDYANQEQVRRSMRIREAQSSLSNLRSQLAAGQLKDAVDEFNRAKQNYNFEGKSESELRQLEGELSRVQGSNLLKSQNEFYAQNTAQFGAAAQSQVQQRLGTILDQQMDSSVAERQWTKLQQGQQVAAIKVQPLRVNLPLRGVRCAFTQVLQTETGKPLTIQMTATNTKTPRWGFRILAGIVGFVVLWTVLARCARREKAA